MSLRLLFSGVGLLALLAGTAMWFGNRALAPGAPASSIQPSPAALYATTFVQADGSRQALGQFQGKVLVVNFWATWCAPCKEEMPAFVRLQQRWGARGVQFVGLADEDPARVRRFASEIGVNYPIWTGGAEVMELSRRLGNTQGVLPHTVLLDGQGAVVDSRIGIFTERDLELRLNLIVPKSS